MHKNILKFIQGPYNLQLIFLVFLFIFRSYLEETIFLAIWKPCLIISLLSSIFYSHKKRALRTLALLSAIPAILFSWANLLNEQSFFFVPNIILTILFLGVAISSIIYDVLLRNPVTYETLRGVICIYFLVAFGFAYYYYLIEYLSPGAVPTRHQHATFSYGSYLSDMLFFSFSSSLLSSNQDTSHRAVQTGIILQGILCQFYIGMLVAKIVSVYALTVKKRQEKNETR